MKIPFWSYDQSPLTDEPALWLKPKDAQDRVSKGYVLPAGKGVQQIAPVGYEPGSELDREVGWNMPFGRMRASCLNEGRCGQFTIGYPIPPAFKGHLRMPKAALVNYAG